MCIRDSNNIIVPLEEEADFRREALRALRCKGSDLLKVDIYRKSVDARKKENIRLNYTIAATLKEGVTLRENAKYRLLMEDKPQFRPGMETMKHRPVIIGLGPAGTVSYTHLDVYKRQQSVRQFKY